MGFESSGMDLEIRKPKASVGLLWCSLLQWIEVLQSPLGELEQPQEVKEDSGMPPGKATVSCDAVDSQSKHESIGQGQPAMRDSHDTKRRAFGKQWQKERIPT